MSKKEDGGPAFPHMAADGHRDYMPGLSMRDWFAGLVMQEIMAKEKNFFPHSGAVDICYQWADAMLAERNK